MKLQDVYHVKKVTCPHEIKVQVPGSKSITNRALLIAALAKGKSTLSGVLYSDDSRHFIRALIDLGFAVDSNEETKVVSITGLGGAIPKKEAKINVGSAGTAARFLTAYLGLAGGRYTIDSSEQMKKRPMKELLVALEQLGAKITYLEEEFHFPFMIENEIASGNEAFLGNEAVSGNKVSSMMKEFPDEVTVDVDKSSQFLSALLIAGVLFRKDFKVHVTGSHGMAYVEMTVKMMEQFGVKVARIEDGFSIPAGSAYQALSYAIEPDLSAACYFYGMSPLIKIPAQVVGVHKDSLQGDIQFLNVLVQMGCSMEEESEGIKIYPPQEELKGGSFDLSSFSDQALTLAAIAPFASAPVEINHVGHIRYQECDRIQAILSNLASLGISATEQDGNIQILPGVTKGCQIKTYEDHRVAMAFSLPGLVTDGVEILDPGCCRKTFENYFEVLEEMVY